MADVGDWLTDIRNQISSVSHPMADISHRVTNISHRMAGNAQPAAATAKPSGCAGNSFENMPVALARQRRLASLNNRISAIFAVFGCLRTD
jgi:hypothetical protein